MSLGNLRAAFVLALVIPACGPGKVEPGDSATATSTTATATATDPTGSSGDVPTGGTTVAVDPCESHLTQGDCDGAGCVWFTTNTVSDLATCELEQAGACVSASASTGDDEYDSAFFRLLDGVVHLKRVGRRACELYGSEHPDGWTECGKGPDDPPECVCVCTPGQCPGDLALSLLEACAFPKPCPDIHANGDEFGWDDQDCFYKALGAGDPAVLSISVNLGDPVIFHRIFLRGDGTASKTGTGCDNNCPGSCDELKWRPPELCTLRESAYFDMCAASEDPAVLAECHDPATWFTGCSMSPATCP